MFIVSIVLSLVLACLGILEDGRREVRFHNAIEDARGSPLRYGPCIDKFAERHAKRLAREQTVYHQDVSKIMDRCGGTLIGEIAIACLCDFSAKDAVDMWLGSESHSRVMVSERYRRAGVARRVSGDFTVVVVVLKAVS